MSKASANLQPWGKSGPSRPSSSDQGSTRGNGAATITSLPEERYQYADNRISWPSRTPSSGGIARQSSRYWADRDASGDLFLPCNGFIGCRSNPAIGQTVQCVFDGLPQCNRGAPIAKNSAFERELRRRWYGKIIKPGRRFSVSRNIQRCPSFFFQGDY
jgi:hypothetical protein